MQLAFTCILMVLLSTLMGTSSIPLGWMNLEAITMLRIATISLPNLSISKVPLTWNLTYTSSIPIQYLRLTFSIRMPTATQNNHISTMETLLEISPHLFKKKSTITNNIMHTKLNLPLHSCVHQFQKTLKNTTTKTCRKRKSNTKRDPNASSTTKTRCWSQNSKKNLEAASSADHLRQLSTKVSSLKRKDNSHLTKRRLKKTMICSSKEANHNPTQKITYQESQI